jgi:hypothetical protein
MFITASEISPSPWATLHYYWREQKKTELEEPISDLLNVTAKPKDHVFTDIFGKILLLQPITLLAFSHY